jgi:HPt (histidine-containing phosphotransfer) domain-containing protein
MTQAADHSTTATLIDPEMLARVDGDRELLAEVIGLFLEDGPMQIEAMRRGLADGDSNAVRRAAHSLAGAAGNFGATDVTASARALEAEALAGNLAASKELFTALQIVLVRMLDRLMVTQTALACAS